MNRTKLHKTINILLRLLIVLLALLFLYKSLLVDHELLPFLDILQRYIHTQKFAIGLLLVVFIMPINLGLEAIKWQFLMHKIEQVGFITALKAVFTGLSISHFLPNRVGDYLGRVFMLKKADRWEGVFLTVVGSIAQLLVTLLFGSMALAVLLINWQQLPETPMNWLIQALAFLLLGGTLFLLIAYFNIQLFIPFIQRISSKRWTRFQKHIHILTHFNKRELLQVLLISTLRYVVFATQLYLLLTLFDIHLSYFSGLLIIALHYLILTVIPTVAITELGVRGSVLVYLIEQYQQQWGAWQATSTVGIITASTLLWMINLALPAAIGLLFVGKLRFLRKNKKYELD